MSDRPQVSVESVDTGEDGVSAVVRVTVRDTPVRVEKLGDGRYLVAVGGRRLRVTLARGAMADWGHVAGATLRWPLAGEPQTALGQHDDAHAASTPATVTEVRVATGDPVAVGDTLVVLEAMKMEMPIRAGRPGRVSAVHCAVGDQVQPGLPLVELEAPD